MSLVNRMVFVSPIEPSPLYLRAGKLSETIIDFQLMNHNGVPLSLDIAGQLRVVGRSSLASRTYSVPAIDIANGRARALIPAGDLDDSSGHQVLLYGSLDGRAALLAKGVIYPDLAAAVPVTEPIDVIDVVPLHLDRNATEPTVLTITLWDDTGKSDPYDLGTSVVTATIYQAPNSIPLVNFNVLPISSNAVEISLTPDQISPLPDDCWWSLVVSNAAGSTTLAQGLVTVTGAPNAFVTSVFSFDYRKPNEGDPIEGQMVHQNFVRDTLKISLLDHDGKDTSILGAMQLGDSVTSTTMLWQVMAKPIIVGGWFEVTVAPLTQMAAEGVDTFTFDRP